MLYSGDLTVVVNRSGGPSGVLFDQRAETADLEKVHPGFRDATSAVLHRFGVDAAYNGWRSTMLSRSRTGARVRPPNGGPPHDKVLRMLFRIQEPGRPFAPIRARKAVERQETAVAREVENGLGVNRVAFRLTARNSPPLFGAGLIDRVSESDLEQEARINRLRRGARSID